METKALARIEPLKPIDVWQLPKDRRKEKERRAIARRKARTELIVHDAMIGVTGLMTLSFVALAAALPGIDAAIAATMLTACMALVCAIGIAQRRPKASALRETAPSKRLNLEAGMEQDLIDSAFRLNDDVFGWSSAVKAEREADAGDLFRNALIVKRERIAKRLGAFESMLGRYRLMIDK